MNYVGEVAELFRSRCGYTKILGATDYTIIAEWEKQQIPFAVVASTIHEIFDRLTADEPTIDSISYFQETVKQNFRAWLQSGEIRA